MRAGTGFSYRDQTGSAIADPALRERIEQLAIPPAWSDVWIAPYPNGHIQATGVDAAGRKIPALLVVALLDHEEAIVSAHDDEDEGMKRMGRARHDRSIRFIGTRVDDVMTWLLAGCASCGGQSWRIACSQLHDRIPEGPRGAHEFATRHGMVMALWMVLHSAQ